MTPGWPAPRRVWDRDGRRETITLSDWKVTENARGAAVMIIHSVVSTAASTVAELVVCAGPNSGGLRHLLGAVSRLRRTRAVGADPRMIGTGRWLAHSRLFVNPSRGSPGCSRARPAVMSRTCGARRQQNEANSMWPGAVAPPVQLCPSPQVMAGAGVAQAVFMIRPV